MQWIESFRPFICLMAGLLTVVSFKMDGRMHESFFPAATVVAIACATMLQNDWRDRHHDAKKGKTLALKNPRVFSGLVVINWAVALIMCLVLLRQDYRMGLLALSISFAGLLYSEIRRIPLVPISLVALTSATPALLAVFDSSKEARHLLLFCLVFAAIWSREIIKDLMDAGSDSGYKWTLPTVMGKLFSRVVAINILILIVFPGIIFLSAFAAIWIWISGMLLAFGTQNHRRAKLCLDIAIAIALLTILLKG